MLDDTLKAQLKAYLERVSQPVELVASLDPRSIRLRQTSQDLGPATLDGTEVLLHKHILDQQIVDCRGSKLQRVNDITMAFSDGTLTLDAGSGDEALATEQIEAAVTGEDITTGFNPQFLLDGLTAIEAPVVELAFTQASKPAVMSGVSSLDGEADGAFRYLLMPRRLLS